MSVNNHRVTTDASNVNSTQRFDPGTRRNHHLATGGTIVSASNGPGSCATCRRAIVAARLCALGLPGRTKRSCARRKCELTLRTRPCTDPTRRQSPANANMPRLGRRRVRRHRQDLPWQAQLRRPDAADGASPCAADSGRVRTCLLGYQRFAGSPKRQEIEQTLGNGALYSWQVWPHATATHPPQPPRAQRYEFRRGLNALPRRPSITPQPAVVRGSFVLTLCGVAAMTSSCWNATQWNAEQLQAVHERATFDLSCPKEKVSVQELGHDPDEGVNTIGVSGCGKKATSADVIAEKS